MHITPEKTSYPSDAIRNEAMSRISKKLRVTHRDGAWSIVAESLGPDASRHHWPLSFETKAAADLFRRDMILAAVDGIDNDSMLPAQVLVAFYELAGHVLTLLEDQRGDVRDLALTIARFIRDQPIDRTDRARR